MRSWHYGICIHSFILQKTHLTMNEAGTLAISSLDLIRITTVLAEKKFIIL